MVGTERLLTAYRRRVRERRGADDWLRSASGTFVPEKYVWRADELCSSRNRTTLARALRRLDASAWSYRPRPGLLDLPAVRTCRPPLLTLAGRLEELSEPVTPAGVLQVRNLITDGGSPLYGADADGIDTLGEAIERIIDLLDVRSPC